MSFRMSVSAYLRAVGQGRAPSSVTSMQAIERLAEISTAQIRLADMLQGRGDTAALLRQVAEFQAQLAVIASRIVP